MIYTFTERAIRNKTKQDLYTATSIVLQTSSKSIIQNAVNKALSRNGIPGNRESFTLKEINDITDSILMPGFAKAA